MKYSSSNPVPPHLRAKIAEMLPKSNREHVAAVIGCSHETVTRIARAMGVRIHARGQPKIGIPTTHNPQNIAWPWTPRGRAPITWA